MSPLWQDVTLEVTENYICSSAKLVFPLLLVIFVVVLIPVVVFVLIAPFSRL